MVPRGRSHRHPRAAGVFGAAEGLHAAAGARITRSLRDPRWRANGPPSVFVGAAEAASSCSLPCEGRGGPGRGAFWISANRGHPLPASPCLRRGRGQGKRDDYNAPVKFLASLVLSSLLPFAAHTQVDGTGDYLSRMDSDGDGRISLVEYQDWMSYAFDGMDRNRDGTLTPDELPGGKGKPVTREGYRARIAATFNKQDVAHNRKSTPRELAAPPQEARDAPPRPPH